MSRPAFCPGCHKNCVLGTVDMAACPVISMAFSPDDLDNERGRRRAHCHAGLCAFTLPGGTLCPEPRHKTMRYCLEHNKLMARERWAANAEKYREESRRRHQLNRERRTVAAGVEGRARWGRR